MRKNVQILPEILIFFLYRKAVPQKKIKKQYPKRLLDIV
jgi:hypothetical protein